MLKKKIILIGIILIIALAVSILLQKGILNLGKNQNEQIAQSESSLGVRGAYTQTDENGKVTAYDSTGNTMAQGRLQEDGTIKWNLNVKATDLTPEMYGSYITGYTPYCMRNEATPSVGWRIFYVDEDNIYLIADDYIENQYTPSASNNNRLNTNGIYKAYFSNILDSYSGSSNITNSHPAYKWIDTYIDAYPNSTNPNMKSVAYMMDTTAWLNSYKDANDSNMVEYAIGGPTLEMFAESYSQTHPSKGIEADSVNNYGYYVKWSDGGYGDGISGLNTSESLYVISDSSKASNTWLASPSAFYYGGVNNVGCRGDVGAYYWDYSDLTTAGFRPIVCLSSNVKLIDNGDGTYSIQ